jgi:NADP-dependent 3-hydroxy acid dehydrogenase YdfG
METPKYRIALIVGAGEGLSASLARLLAKQGIRIALAARQIEKLGALCRETGSRERLVRTTMTADHREAVQAFIDKRKAVFKGK